MSDLLAWHVLIIVVTAGVGLKATLATFKYGTVGFDARQTAKTAIVGFLSSFALVQPMLEPHLVDGYLSLADPSALPTVAGLILLVMGADTAANAVGKKLTNKPAERVA